MKILMANDYKTVIGGAEKYVYSLKAALEKKGHSVRIFGSNKSYDEYIQFQKTKSLQRYFNKMFNIKKYYELKKIIKEFKPDIIHLHNIYNELSPSILLAANSIPVVLTVHDTLLVNPVSLLSGRTGFPCKHRTCRGCTNCIGLKGAIYEFFRAAVYKILLKKINLFITPSKYMHDFMSEAGFSPVTIVNNGSKLFQFSQIVNFSNLLFIGRLSKDKGVEYLMKAMHKVVKVLPRVKLVLVGDGPDKDYFVELGSKLKIESSIKFIGPVEEKYIKSYYVETSAVMVPSILPDNFPTVCIEAMSVGRPIIGTSVGGIPELIDESKNGFLVPPQNDQELAEKIIKLFSDRKLILRMANESHKKSQRYSLNDHTIHIENIYKNILEN